MKKAIQIFIVIVWVVLDSCNNRSQKENSASKNESPESFIKNDPRLTQLQVPNELAALPFCYDSIALAQHKKIFCAQRKLSEHLIRLHPEWNSATGLVNLALIVDPDGMISEVILLDDFTGISIGAAVSKACQEFLKDFKCIAGKKNGEVIKSKLEIPVYFGLDLLGNDFVQ